MKNIVSRMIHALRNTPTAPNPLPEPVLPATGVQADTTLACGDLDLESALPAGVAMLRITEFEGDSYQVAGSHAGGDLVRSEPAPAPAIALEGFIREDITVEGILGSLLFFSQELKDLTNWLTELSKLGGHLVIKDETGFGIPWELLPFGKDRNFLGATLPCSRWIEADTNHGPVASGYVDQIFNGRVLAYLHVAELQGTETENRLLAEHWPEDLHQDLAGFEAALKQNRTDLALIYMACHGQASADIQKCTLGSRDNIAQQWTLGNLNWKELPALETSKCIFFINACNSGLHHDEDPRLRDKKRRGFPDLFLRKGAGAIIATHAEVNDFVAGELGRAFIEASLLEDSPTIAETKSILVVYMDFHDSPRFPTKLMAPPSSAKPISLLGLPVASFANIAAKSVPGFAEIVSLNLSMSGLGSIARLNDCVCVITMSSMAPYMFMIMSMSMT